MDTTIKIQKLYKFKKSWMIKKAHRVVALMNEVINSDEFREEIKKFNFKDRRYQENSKGEIREILDNEEILGLLKRGREQDSTDGIDYTWKLYIALGRLNSQVGRREGNLIITQNWLLKTPKNDAAVASHWFHEYAHVLGFKHDFDDTDIRPFSVPYALNEIVERVLANRQATE